MKQLLVIALCAIGGFTNAQTTTYVVTGDGMYKLDDEGSSAPVVKATPFPADPPTYEWRRYQYMPDGRSTVTVRQVGSLRPDEHIYFSGHNAWEATKVPGLWEAKWDFSKNHESGTTVTGHRSVFYRGIVPPDLVSAPF